MVAAQSFAALVETTLKLSAVELAIMRSVRAFLEIPPPEALDVWFYSGGSMLGTFRLGDCLQIEPAAFDQLGAGDVVAFLGPVGQASLVPCVHRIVSVLPNGLVMRGDNSRHSDARLLTEDDWLGLVSRFERDGTLRRVQSGWIGLQRARLLWIRRYVYDLCAWLVRKPYRWLRTHGLLRHFWQPTLTQIHLMTDNGPLIKYIFQGHTVASWLPEQDYFECRKPFDLVLSRPDRSV